MKCAHCGRELDDNSVRCIDCEKDFCYGKGSTCLADYHAKHNLRLHRIVALINPDWKIKIMVHDDEMDIS